MGRRETRECDELKKFFLQEKPSDMIAIIKMKEKSYAGELSDLTDTTYSHAVKVMNRMSQIGLLKCNKRGRKKEYVLTNKGEKVAEKILAMYRKIDEIECPEVAEENWKKKSLKETK